MQESVYALYSINLIHRGIGHWSLYDFASYCKESKRSSEFKHELYSQKTYETIVLKRYASSQTKSGLDYEGFVRFHWDCRMIRTLHDDLGILKIDIRSILDREKERIYNSMMLISQALLIPVKLPERTRKLLEKEAKKEVRRQEREGERVRKPKIPEYLELPEGAILPQHVRLFVYDLYKLVITEEHAHEIICKYGWTDDVPYLLIDDFVAKIMKDTEYVTVSSLVEKEEDRKQKVLMDKMKIMSSKKGKGQHDPAGDDLNSEVKKPKFLSLVVYRRRCYPGGI